MPKWRDKDYDDDKYIDKYEKRDKIRKKPSVMKTSDQLTDTFERPEDDWEEKLAAGAFAARVVEVHKRYVFVSREDKLGKIDTRDVWIATMSRKFLIGQRAERNFVCVGDRVLCLPSEKRDESIGADLPQCSLLHVAPRTARIARVDPSQSDREHVLASNMQQVLVVASFLNPKVRWGLIDRYLVLAEREGVVPIVVLNKKDLIPTEAPEFAEDCAARVQEYRRLGYEVLEMQANAAKVEKSAEVKRLKQIFKGKITLLSGHSGVGKSSLVNLFDPELVQVVEENELFYKGRHTTTFASFIKLGTGGYAIDTPGIRSFSIGKTDAISLSGCFPEMRELLGKCKFRECAHDKEPDCAVKTSMEAGVVKPWRHRTYLGMLHGDIEVV